MRLPGQIAWKDQWQRSPQELARRHRGVAITIGQGKAAARGVSNDEMRPRRNP